MTETNHHSTLYWQRARNAYVWSHLLTTPFWAIYNMLPFILYRDLHATPWQITVFITLKPVVSIFSMYWSAMTIKRRDRLRSNLNWAKILGLLPFFFLPWIHNVWAIILFSGLFIMLARGVIPAWMEVLKLNIPNTSRKKIFSFVSALSYLGGGLLPIVFGWLMDDHHQAWRWIFPLMASLSILGLFFQNKILIPRELEDHPGDQEKLLSIAYSWKEKFLHPWRKVWELMKSRPDFSHYQIGFMLGGSGIMIWQPALPDFFMGVLNLSYTELAVAFSLCKGIGFILSSPFWTQWMHRINIFHFSALITVLAALFPLCLLAAQYSLIWLYLAYISYGIMQAGSEMSWNLSGPIFAKEEDSTVYSSVNVVTVGIRGCVAPPLGSLLCVATNPSVVLGVGCLFCLLASWRMASYGKRAGALVPS